MTMPLVTCALVAAICCALTGALVPALVVVGFCMVFEFFLPAWAATSATPAPVEEDSL
jgi:hypothetical protein